MSTTVASEITMEDLLAIVVEEGASDLHIEVGSPPVLRINGHLNGLDTESLRPEDTDRLMRAVTSEDYVRQLSEIGGADFGFGFQDLARFRVSIFKQKGHVGMVLRQIPNDLLTLEQIGLPPQTKELLYKPKGLVLVTGPTGSGKSTTLASMINIINEDRDCHIITVEDPIEFYHDHKQSLVIQRELGVDVGSFSKALVSSLRQDPDVILVGEMRDLDTMEAAISAAET
ncbi:MAG: ATPase, T2SS/T4P/T4SS family, partial [Kiritimatiellia bacterium]